MNKGQRKFFNWRGSEKNQDTTFSNHRTTGKTKLKTSFQRSGQKKKSVKLRGLKSRTGRRREVLCDESQPTIIDRRLIRKGTNCGRGKWIRTEGNRNVPTRLGLMGLELNSGESPCGLGRKRKGEKGEQEDHQ